MCRVMVDGVDRGAAAALLTQRLTRVGINIKSWEVTTRDIEPNTVAASKD